MQALHEKTFSTIFKGQSKAVVDLYVLQLLEQQLSKLIYLPAYKRLQEAARKGEYIVLLSSSPDFIVGPIAKKFSVNRWCSSVYKTNSDGFFEYVESIMQGKEKADFITSLVKELAMEDSTLTVYTDSYLDMPLLELADRAIAVKPDRKLRRTCSQYSWEVIDES